MLNSFIFLIGKIVALAADMIRVRLRTSLVIASLGLAIFDCHAVETSVTAGGYQDTLWTGKDGAPGDVWAIAQTTDGWLWFGGPTGLFRFDGIRFERVELEASRANRSQAVSALFALDSGSLLIGNYNGGISLFEGGRLQHLEDDEQARSTIYAFAQGQDGVLWATSRHGMLRYDGNRWRTAGSDWNLSDALIRDVILDRQGTLWISSDTQVYRLLPGDHRFQPAGIPVALFGAFVEAPDGRVWLSDGSGIRTLPGQVAVSAISGHLNRSKSSTGDLFDFAGRYWSNYIPPNRRLQIAKLVGEIQQRPEDVKTMLEDQDGNIWTAGTGREIHRLRRENIKSIPMPSSRISRASFASGAHGKVWVVVLSGMFGAFKDDGVWTYEHGMSRVPRPSLASAIYTAPDGFVWVAGPDGLWNNRHGVMSLAFPIPENLKGSLVSSIAVESGGTVWVSIVGQGLHKVTAGLWQRMGAAEKLPSVEPKALDFDSEGRLWLGYANGDVRRLSGDSSVLLGTADQTKVGSVLSLSLGRRVLVGGEDGLAVMANGKFVRLVASGEQSLLQYITGIVQSDSGDVWINGANGAVRIAGAQMGGTASNGVLAVSTELFAVDDGIFGLGISNAPPLPSMHKGVDGKIWLSVTGGIAWIDSNSLPYNSLRPRAFLRGVLFDSKAHDMSKGSPVSAGTRNIQFDYTALNYAHPDRLQFEYRLTGYDRNWVLAGQRRQAFYTNLGPGRYVFDVRAATETGLWSDHPASFEFEIPPTFVQTRSFLLICCVASLLLLVVLYQVRIRQVKTQQRIRMQVRMGERGRIARELHDTLLQSTQGLILSFGAHVKDIAAGSAARLELEQTLLLAKEAMKDGRDRVQGLRLEEDTTGELTAALARVGEQLAAQAGMSFRLSVHGTIRELDADVKEEAFRILREALLNACRHSRASTVEVLAAYQRTVLRISVRDDGVGFDEDTQIGSPASGHWGLPGMHERARELGAGLDIVSRLGQGTEVVLELSARVAYAGHRRRIERLFRRHRSYDG